MNLLSMNVGEQRDFKVGLVTYTAERTGGMTWELHSTVEGWKTAHVGYIQAGYASRKAQAKGFI